MTTDHSGPGDSGLASQFDAQPEQVAELYDGWANADYDADLANWNYEAPARAAAITTEALADAAGARILDAGCGTGLVGIELRRRGATHIIGGDFSPASVEVARQRGVYDEVFHLDLNAPLQFADDSLDAVVSIGVFSYLTDSRATIVELLRVTAPGGCVVFTQRSDLWTDRDFDALIAGLVDERRCTASISDVAPYLPGHPEFGDDIGIRYVTLQPSSTS
jgi:predicted TPR repeat methyltransferase